MKVVWRERECQSELHGFVLPQMEFKNVMKVKDILIVVVPCVCADDHIYSRTLLSTDCTLEQSIPSVEIFMLKIFMSLVVGITSGMWIWSSKTVRPLLLFK